MAIVHLFLLTTALIWLQRRQPFGIHLLFGWRDRWASSSCSDLHEKNRTDTSGSELPTQKTLSCCRGLPEGNILHHHSLIHIHCHIVTLSHCPRRCTLTLQVFRVTTLKVGGQPVEAQKEEPVRHGMKRRGKQVAVQICPARARMLCTSSQSVNVEMMPMSTRSFPVHQHTKVGREHQQEHYLERWSKAPIFVKTSCMQIYILSKEV